MLSGPVLPAEISARRNFFLKTKNQASHRDELLRNIVRLLDKILRRALGIHEFCLTADCLLRIAVTHPSHKMSLPKTAIASPYDTLIDLHLWNDHFKPLLAGEPAFARATLIQQHLQLSLHFLAEYLVAHPEINAPMIHARVVMPIGERFAKLRTVAKMYGFTVTTPLSHGLSPIHDFFENFLVRALMWTFNPVTSHRRRLRLRRADLWIHRDTLLNRYLLGANEKPYCDEAVPESCGSRL